MKKLSIVTLALVLLTGCSVIPPVENSSQGSSAVVSPDTRTSPPVGLSPGDDVTVSGEDNFFRLHSLNFLDSDTGFVIKDRYDGTTGNPRSLLLSTRDGGASWDEVGTDKNVLYKVFFIDAQEGWAISRADDASDPDSDDTAVPYTILHTTDGGAAWNVQWQNEQAASADDDLWFQDQATGFALVGGVMLATVNGGNRWSEISFGTDFIPQHMCFTGGATGWVIGLSGKDGDAVSVLHTTDGGQSWVTRLSRDYHECAGPIRTVGIDFADAENGWFLVSEGGMRSAYLYHTSDGGVNWEEINTIEAARPMPMGLCFVTAEVGWIPLDVGAGPLAGGLMVTRDGGKSLTVVGDIGDRDPEEMRKIISAKEIGFVSVQTGWAVGSNGDGDYLVRTVDGGNTWEQVYPELTPTRDVSFVDARTGFGLGAPSDAGALLRTSDGGNT